MTTPNTAPEKQEPDLNALTQLVTRLLPCDAAIIMVRPDEGKLEPVVAAASHMDCLHLGQLLAAMEESARPVAGHGGVKAGVFAVPQGDYRAWLTQSLDEEIAGGPLLICLNRNPAPFSDITLARLASMGDVMASSRSDAASIKPATPHRSVSGIGALTRHLDTRITTTEISSATPLALLRLDLGRIGPINDSDGWPTSDVLISRAHGLLTEIVASSGLVVHLGGGSFSIVHPIVSDVSEATELGNRIVHRLSERSDAPESGFPFEPYIGWAAYPFDAPDTDTLVGFANAALAQIRGIRSGPRVNRVAPEIAHFHAEQIGMENDLRQAIEAGAFTLNWLPVLETNTEQVVAFEALVRWTRPGRGIVEPSIFLPCAENAGLIEDIDRWVLHEACAQACLWEQPLGVSINVSPSWLETERVAATIAKSLKDTGLDPSRLQIELSERRSFGPSDSARKELSRIRAMGVRLVLDDFGTGIGALERLTNYPFDQVKLDRMFIKRLGSDSRVETVLRSTLHMIHSLNMTCCAEGVETEEQLGFLDAHGCEEIQGYLIGRPTIELPIRRSWEDANRHKGD